MLRVGNNKPKHQFIEGRESCVTGSSYDRGNRFYKPDSWHNGSGGNEYYGITE